MGAEEGREQDQLVGGSIGSIGSVRDGECDGEFLVGDLERLLHGEGHVVGDFLDQIAPSPL